MSSKEHDPVNSPSHYASGAVEAIDAMQAAMTAEQFVGYCKGSAMKYLWRFDMKGKAKEDLEKAAWYLDRLQRAVAIRDAVDAVEAEVKAEPCEFNENCPYSCKRIKR
jgi:hypothetical protein